MPNLKLIEAKTVGSGGTASITFTSIPQTYTDLKILVSGRTTGGVGSSGELGTISFSFGSTSYTYSDILLGGNGSSIYSTNNSVVATSVPIYWLNGNGSTANTFANINIDIPNYTSNNIKNISYEAAPEFNDSTIRLILGAVSITKTDSVTEITLTAGQTAFAQHSTFYLYGISNVTTGSKATGGIVSYDSTYYYHMFPYSGTFTPTQSLTADVLVIAGGGGGGKDKGGGGGAGGVSYQTSRSLSATPYTITVGAGGSGSTGYTTSNSTGGSGGSNGSNSVFDTITSVGGGLGATDNTTNYRNGASGGSGGGATRDGTIGSATQGNSGGATGYGNNGGSGINGSSNYYGGGGGGGAGAVGSNGTTSPAASGGAGLNTWSSWANATQTGVNGFYAGGGGAGNYNANNNGQAGGVGGAGGGGTGGGSGGTGVGAGVGLNAVANTGSGGGGGGDASNGGAGGSGIVIIRYAI